MSIRTCANYAAHPNLCKSYCTLGIPTHRTSVFTHPIRKHDVGFFILACTRWTYPFSFGCTTVHNAYCRRGFNTSSFSVHLVMDLYHFPITVYHSHSNEIEMTSEIFQDVFAMVSLGFRENDHCWNTTWKYLSKLENANILEYNSDTCSKPNFWGESFAHFHSEILHVSCCHGPAWACFILTVQARLVVDPVLLSPDTICRSPLLRTVLCIGCHKKAYSAGRCTARPYPPVYAGCMADLSRHTRGHGMENTLNGLHSTWFMPKMLPYKLRNARRSEVPLAVRPGFFVELCFKCCNSCTCLSYAAVRLIINLVKPILLPCPSCHWWQFNRRAACGNCSQ